LRDIGAEDFADARDRDVLVMAGLGLGRRAEDRRLQLFAFGKAACELLAGQRAGRRIFLPGRAEM